MNKKIKEAKERLNNFKAIMIMCGDTFAIHSEQLEQLQKDIETVLNYTKNSIPKKEIEEKIEEINEEFKSRNTPNNNEWYLESEKYAYAEEKLQDLLEGK